MVSMRKTKVNQPYFIRVWYVGGRVVLNCAVRSWSDYDDVNASFICPC
jgi:hypothetical protein